jgi:predicted secreted protein
MAAQKGKDLLLKVDTNGSGRSATVAGLRAEREAKTLTLAVQQASTSC